MSVNTGIIRYFEKWGDFEEKVGRQGKGAQNVCNEPIDPCLEPWVHPFACLGENRFSKLQFLKNHPYLTSFWKRAARNFDVMREISLFSAMLDILQI